MAQADDQGDIPTEASKKNRGASPDATGPSKPSAANDRTESLHSTKTDPPTVIVGTAGQPKSKPTGGVFAANPKIQKLVEEAPGSLPYVNLVAQVDQARAEAEVVFRQRELTERWAEWSGPYPWDEEKDPDTTDCPWWVAGAEYVFHVTDAWRTHSPDRPEAIEAFCYSK